ncbi:hypothetical protein [Francisella sp. SYW-2]|uniref:hypothetical protein n=1 Tax=Francisella sp. SYW-2 TaxID=2610886 RepID=UPI00123CB3D3|nr:hypothetical protein [Francisella sp. SYW-2]
MEQEIELVQEIQKIVTRQFESEEGKRLICAIDQQPWYKSTGSNSGLPGIWLPFGGIVKGYLFKQYFTVSVHDFGIGPEHYNAYGNDAIFIISIVNELSDDMPESRFKNLKCLATSAYLSGDNFKKITISDNDGKEFNCFKQLCKSLTFQQEYKKAMKKNILFIDGGIILEEEINTFLVSQGGKRGLDSDAFLEREDDNESEIGDIEVVEVNDDSIEDPFAGRESFEEFNSVETKDQGIPFEIFKNQIDLIEKCNKAILNNALKIEEIKAIRDIVIEKDHFEFTDINTVKYINEILENNGNKKE